MDGRVPMSLSHPSRHPSHQEPLLTVERIETFETETLLGRCDLVLVAWRVARVMKRNMSLVRGSAGYSKLIISLIPASQ